MNKAKKPVWTEQEMLYMRDAAYHTKRLKKQRKRLVIKLGYVMQKLKDEKYRCMALTHRSERAVQSKLVREMKKISVIVLVLIFVLGSICRASVPATLDYSGSQFTETQWLNHVTITNNTTDDLWAANFEAVGIVPLDWPENWNPFFTAEDDLGFVSLLFGPPPAGADVPPDASVTLMFLTPEQPSSIPFTLQFVNSHNLDTDVAGTLNADGSVVFTPEPSTGLAMCVAFLFCWRRNYLKRVATTGYTVNSNVAGVP